MDGYFQKILHRFQINTIFIKKTRSNAGISIWVDDGARTHDPQNHNLML